MTCRRVDEAPPAAGRGRRSAALAASLALLAVLAAAPAPADWLVLEDGSKIETAGPWRVDGRLVVFELADGRLASLRVEEVLLAASERATAAASVPPAPAEPPPRRKARVVITDADIPRARPEPEPAEGDGDGAGQARASDLVVLSWEAVESPFGGGVQIYGTVQNQGPGTLTGAGLRVLLYDPEGLLLTSGEARLTGSVLPTQARSNFMIGFDSLYGGINGGVFAFAGVRFDPYYRGLEPWSERVESEPAG